MQSVKITSDKDNRNDFKNRLLNKVETALTPAPAPVETEPEVIEILDKYSTWVPAGLALESQEFLPDFKKDESYIPQHELEERAMVKNNLLTKVEESLVPVEIEAEVPVEIIEKYSNWIPARLQLEPAEQLSPEFHKTEVVLSPHEVEKRGWIKQGMLEKLAASLIPVEAEKEVKTIEIVEKFSSGIPKPSLEPVEAFYPENRRVVERVVLDTDVPKREAFKDSLAKKLNSLPVVEASVVEENVVGDYSQRSVVPYGLDFEEANRPELIVGDFQEETILNFNPVTEEAPLPVLRLPENYGELDERALYGILIRNSDLRHTSETANLALDVLSGRSSREVEFVIVETPKPVVIEPLAPKKTAEIPVIEEAQVEEPQIDIPEKIELLKPYDFDFPPDWRQVPLSTLRTDLLATGATPEQVDAKMASITQQTPAQIVSKETKIQELSIDLPEEFTSWKSTSQYLYLTKERLLTPEQANTVIWELK